MRADRWLHLEFAVLLVIVALIYLSAGQTLWRWLAS